MLKLVALNTSMCESFNKKKIRRIAREVKKTLIFSGWIRYYTDEAELVKIIYASRSAFYFFLCFQQQKCDMHVYLLTFIMYILIRHHTSQHLHIQKSN